MRLTKSRNRQQILAAAARLIRERGFDEVALWFHQRWGPPGSSLFNPTAS